MSTMFSQRTPVLNFMGIVHVQATLIHVDGRTDGQMERKQKDGHYEENRGLSSLCERAYEIYILSTATFCNCCGLR